MNAVQFAALTAAFGAYCLEVADELKQQQVYMGLQSINRLGINLKTGIRDRMQYAIPFVKSVLQKGKQTAFNPVANVVDFVPREWNMQPWQVDLSFDRRSFDDTFLQHYKSPSRQISESDDLIEMMMAMIMKKLLEDIELAIWQGRRTLVAPGANAAEPLAIFDGFLELIVQAITALELTPVVTGAITTVNAVDSINTVWKGLTNKTRMGGSYAYVSFDVLIKFIENYVALNGENNAVISYIFNQWVKNGQSFELMTDMPDIPLPLSGGKCIIRPVWGMGDSQRIIVASQLNGGVMSVGMGDEKDMLGLHVDPDHRNLDIMMDGAIACQFGAFAIDGETYVSVNDQL